MKTDIELRLEAHDLPRSPGLHVALQKRKEVEDPRRIAGPVMTFELSVSVLTVEGQLDFRGPYVQGTRGDRFIYLVWGAMSGGVFQRVSRTKIILDEIPAELVRAAESAPETPLTASFAAGAEGGGPVTGRVRPDAVTWRFEPVRSS